jgi:hypothetical protein
LDHPQHAGRVEQQQVGRDLGEQAPAHLQPLAAIEPCGGKRKAHQLGPGGDDEVEEVLVDVAVGHAAGACDDVGAHVQGEAGVVDVATDAFVVG